MTTGREWLLRCESLDAGYGKIPVLKEVSFTVHTGECWFVVGPNGQGKSTLLKTILGLLPPIRGRLERNAALAPNERTGYVPQRGDLEPHVRTTVREFVGGGFAGLSWGRARQEESRTRARALARLEDLENRDMRSLSGGQRQRALVARALVRRPTLLVVDEPTAGLDASISETLMEVLQRVRSEEGTAILFVGHDLRQARRQATHAGLVWNGRVKTGAADEVLTGDNLREAYAGMLDPLRDGDTR